jgi:hypothetical protein
MARSKRKQKNKARSSSRPTLPVAAEVAITGNPRHQGIVDLRGTVQDDGTILGGNGITWRLA